jgi:hypothetical protein
LSVLAAIQDSPLQQQEMQDEVNAFQQRNGFSGIVGAIDGTHIRIKAPSSHPQSFVNRRGFHSIQTRAVCRHNMLFSHSIPEF